MNRDDIKAELLKNALKIVPFEGWSIRSLESITKASGHPPLMDQLFFPNGAIDFIEYFHTQLDDAMIMEISTCPEKGVRKRIAHALLHRFNVYQDNRAFIIKTFHHLCLPRNFIAAKRMSWQTINLIWYHAGHDQSTDFNYYTKRALLHAVYSSVFMYWLSDDSHDFIDTKNFMLAALDKTVYMGAKLGKLMSCLNSKSV